MREGGREGGRERGREEGRERMVKKEMVKQERRFLKKVDIKTRSYLLHK